MAIAIRSALDRWSALLRFCEDGRVEMDNNAAERALRAVAMGRKNYLFAGSDAGGERGAVIYSLPGSAKLNGIDFSRALLDRAELKGQELWMPEFTQAALVGADLEGARTAADITA